MLKFLKSWLGWDSDSGPFDFGDLRIGSGRRPPAPQTQVRPPPEPRLDAQTRSASPSQPAQASAQPKNAAPKTPRKERAPIDVLDDPRLTLDRPTDDGFDPYNTGAFNRSTSWERIGRHKR